MDEKVMVPRVIGALAGGMAMAVAMLLSRWVGYRLSADEHVAITAAAYTLAQLAYAVVHRKLSRTMNPTDGAVPGATDAAVTRAVTGSFPAPPKAA